jgi:hypothetical protein
MEHLTVETAQEAKRRGMPPPIIKPLDDYVALPGGGYTTKEFARKFARDPPTDAG